MTGRYVCSVCVRALLFICGGMWWNLEQWLSFRVDSSSDYLCNQTLIWLQLRINIFNNSRARERLQRGDVYEVE